MKVPKSKNQFDMPFEIESGHREIINDVYLFLIVF